MTDKTIVEFHALDLDEVQAVLEEADQRVRSAEAKAQIAQGKVVDQANAIKIYGGRVKAMRAEINTLTERHERQANTIALFQLEPDGAQETIRQLTEELAAMTQREGRQAFRAMRAEETEWQLNPTLSAKLSLLKVCKAELRKVTQARDGAIRQAKRWAISARSARGIGTQFTSKPRPLWSDETNTKPRKYYGAGAINDTDGGAGVHM